MQRSCGRKKLGVLQGKTAESRGGERLDGVGRGQPTQAWWPWGGACIGPWGQEATNRAEGRVVTNLHSEEHSLGPGLSTGGTQ